MNAYTPLTGKTRLIATVAISSATFMNVLDSSIANVSIPTIAGDMGVSASQGTWVITSFAVANAIGVPLTGWLTQRFGQVHLFVTSIMLFVLASLLCGLAPNLETLIAFRVLQGLVAGPMIPLSQALMLSSFPKEKSGMALALWGMTTLVAPVMGPLLGGWISDNFSWPWIFYINVPVGILSAAITWHLYKDRETERKKLPIDVVGLALLVLWVSCLQIMLDKGKELDWFASGEIILLTAAAAVFFVCFLIWELTEKNPIVDLSLFQRRNFTTGTITSSVAYAIFFGTVVLMPLWMQTTLHYTPTWAGIVSAPVGILAIVLTPIVGKMLAKTDPRSITTFAFIVFALVSWMRSHFSPDVDALTLAIPTFIQGAAMATFFIPLMSITLSGLTPDKIPAASGLSNFVRITAGGFGTSIATTQWENRTHFHHATFAENITPGNPALETTLLSLKNLGMNATQALSYIDGLLTSQAQTLAMVEIYHLSAIIFLVLMGIVWLSKPIRSPSKSAPIDVGH